MNVLKTLKTLGCGVLVGTAGFKVLASADAKKVYTHATAAVKRGVDEVMKTVTNIRENCQDISADADEINEKRCQEAEAKMIEDAKEVLRAAEEKAEGAEA
ncbi:MAG: hypothetical protein HXM02_03375 [[Eubacterium] sulci]|jgi:hypothetical protein rflaF_10459|nr:hypothetical protein [[Eubacterium] sulci]MBF1187089.1 hypothetical protein [[Eubacterium] sulci]